MDDPEIKAVIEAAQTIERNLYTCPSCRCGVISGHHARALTKALAALDAAQAAQKPVCGTGGGNGGYREVRPYGDPAFWVKKCPDCNGTGTKSSGEIRG
jgi:DnaJ-class molecular chaperone